VAAGAVTKRTAHPVPQFKAHPPPAAGPQQCWQGADACQHQPRNSQRGAEPQRAALCRHNQPGGVWCRSASASLGRLAPRLRQRWRGRGRRFQPGGLRPLRLRRRGLTGTADVLLSPIYMAWSLSIHSSVTPRQRTSDVIACVVCRGREATSLSYGVQVCCVAITH